MTTTSTSPRIRARAQCEAQTNSEASDENNRPRENLPDIESQMIQPRPDEGTLFIAHAHPSDVIGNVEARESPENIKSSENPGGQNSPNGVSIGDRERDLEDEHEEIFPERSALARAENRWTDIRAMGASSTHPGSEDGAIRAGFKSSGNRPSRRERHMDRAPFAHISNHYRKIFGPDSRPYVESHLPARGVTPPLAGEFPLRTPSISQRISLSDNKQREINNDLNWIIIDPSEDLPNESDWENIVMQCSAMSIEPDLSGLSHQSTGPELQANNNSFTLGHEPDSRTSNQEIPNPNSKPVHSARDKEDQIKDSSTPKMESLSRNKSVKSERGTSVRANSQRVPNNYIDQMLSTLKLDSQPPKRSRRKPLIKPIPPLKYDGSANLRAFNRFSFEGTQYVIDGNVEKERQVIILSYYLTRKSIQFLRAKNFSQFQGLEPF